MTPQIQSAPSPFEWILAPVPGDAILIDPDGSVLETEDGKILEADQ